MRNINLPHQKTTQVFFFTLVSSLIILVCDSFHFQHSKLQLKHFVTSNKSSNSLAFESEGTSELKTSFTSTHRICLELRETIVDKQKMFRTQC